MLQLPKHRRALVNRRALMARLDALDGELSREARRAQVLEILRQSLADGRAEVRRRFERSATGLSAAQAHSYLIDQLIRVLHDDTAEKFYPAPNPTLSERLTLVATGGYGRGQLAPQSDVDLLFLLPYKQTPRGEQVVEHMLYMLWDLGLKVGHATRSIAECLRFARADLTVRTALLEARYVWGEQALFAELQQRFAADIVAGSARDFVEQKLAERDARHVRMGDSRYVLEPNIKEGKGGLRALPTLFWIAKYAYRVSDVGELTARGVLTAPEVAKFAKAESFLWTIRFQLHYLTGRPEERLTFDVQAELARRMGYTDHAGSRGVERFMKHYFLVAKDVGDLTRIFCAALEAEQQRKPRLSLARLWGGWRRDLAGFRVEGERLNIADAESFLADPVNFIRLFSVAHQHGLDIHPTALRLITQNLRRIDAAMREDREANRLFLEILTSKTDPETSLRRMNEAGVFGRFVPDFGRVVAQMQYDMYHVYTVDEHTLFAIGILHQIEEGALKDELPLATAIAPTIVSRRALYVATLLHDIAKGRGGDHSELGEKIGYKLGPRLGLTLEETETVAWLVRWHLLMSSTAFKFDISDPQTIQNFVDRVQSPERLKLLLVLTIADIRAVGPKVWNGWKATLLRELFHSAHDLLTGGATATARDSRIAEAQEDVRQLLPEFSDADFAAFVGRGYPFYWLSLDAETHARHARLMREADRGGAPLSVETRIDAQRAVTEVTVYTADHPGLFSRIAGAIAVNGCNIVDAKIMTMTNGMALDTFWIQDQNGEPVDRPDKLARLSVAFENVLTGDLKPHREFARPPAFHSRTNVFTVPPRVLIDNQASRAHTVIEVNGRDRPGLLHELTRELTRLKLQVSSAKISTYGEKVVDVFYVKNLFGHRVEQDEKLAEIRTALTKVLAKSNHAPAPTTSPRRTREPVAAK
jgi:[protein-PII] uridylyltransferase